MRRKQLFELHDYDWFPRIWRDIVTDILSEFEVDTCIYAPVAGLLAPLIEREDEFAIVDLCSGGGLPVVTVLDAMDEGLAARVRVTLTDLFPNLPAFEEVSRRSGGRIDYSAEPVDATAVPEDIQGFRTFFSSFHHFDRDMALSILRDTVAKRQGIGIFEYTERRLFRKLYWWIVPLPWILWRTFSKRPRDRRRIFWTCVVPVVLLTFGWDAPVSCLRTYSVTELEELVRALGDCGYTWEAGVVDSCGPFRVTYLIGCPTPSVQDQASTFKRSLKQREETQC